MVIKITPDGLPELGMVEIATTQYEAILQSFGQSN